MTPWHRFWFPHLDEEPDLTRDAALWSPQALADVQQALWRTAAQASENWWRYWSDAWADLPASFAPVAPTLCPPSPRRRGRDSGPQQ